MARGLGEDDSKVTCVPVILRARDAAIIPILSLILSSTTSGNYLSKRPAAGLFMTARHEIVRSPSETGVRYHAR